MNDFNSRRTASYTVCESEVIEQTKASIFTSGPSRVDYMGFSAFENDSEELEETTFDRTGSR